MPKNTRYFSKEVCLTYQYMSIVPLKKGLRQQMHKLPLPWIVVDMSSRFELMLEVLDHANERVNHKL